jgi:hypothetical protein
VERVLVRFSQFSQLVAEQPLIKEIDVEILGGTLMVQHYIEEIGQPDHLRLVSISHVFTPTGCTKIGVIWDLSVRKIDASPLQHVPVVQPFLPHEPVSLIATVKNSPQQDDAPAAIALRNPLPGHGRKAWDIFKLSVQEAAALARPHDFDYMGSPAYSCDSVR